MAKKPGKPKTAIKPMGKTRSKNKPSRKTPLDKKRKGNGAAGDPIPRTGKERAHLRAHR